jgi:hypothetical protein
MQIFFLFIYLLPILFALATSSNLDVGNSCIINYLKEKNKLSEDFPSPRTPDLIKCRLVMPLILKNLNIALKTKMKEREDIQVDCIMRHLNNSNALDFMLMREIVPMSRDLDNSEIMQKTRNATKILRKILVNSARKCESDITYGGLFDDILGIQNLSLPLLQHNYCYTRYAIENKLIEVKHVNMNPRRISIKDVNCEEIIQLNQVARERQLLEKLNKRDISKEQIQCIMDKYRSERAFDSNVALEVIDLLHISYEEKRSNRENIAVQLENFIESIFACNKLNQDDNVKILQL